MISSIVKSTFLLTLSTAKKVAIFVAPVTPVFIKKSVQKIVVLSEKMYEKPYETTKQITPARLFDTGEKLSNYGLVIFFKSQSVVFSTKAWAEQKVARVYSFTSALESFVKAKVQYTINTVTSTIKESQNYAVRLSRSQIFSGKTA